MFTQNKKCRQQAMQTCLLVFKTKQNAGRSYFPNSKHAYCSCEGLARRLWFAVFSCAGSLALFSAHLVGKSCGEEAIANASDKQ